MGKIFSITEGLENLGALRTGGQGSVYKARRGEEITAVKILPTPLHSEDLADKSYRDFQNEVTKLKMVNESPSPHVVKILSSGITDSGSLPFIEMEFIEGPDLQDMLLVPGTKAFTVDESIRVAEQLSNALAHCHKVQVKHGDIKSNNVKLNVKTDKYMLLDFGLSIMSDEQRRTSLRHAGAIEFMAPEQNDGEMLMESDVYSFGIIMFELLAGQVPFPLNSNSETSRNAVMVSHMEKPVPDLLEIRRSNMPENWDESKREAEMQIPAWLQAVIAKCLEKLPVNRFRDGVELNQAIVESIAGRNAFAYTPLAAAIPLVVPTPEPVVAVPAHKPGIDAIPDNPALNLDSPTSSRDYKKPLILAAVFLLICLALFAGYRSLKSPAVDTVDSTAINAENQRLLDSLADAERIQDSLDNLPKYTEPAPVAQVNRGNGKGNGKGKGRGKGKKKK
ncbi:serine/threonine protein kinase [Daejeonella lutea]|uniref:Protein kinase domain-containing protein n=1 Tax=Daejeonella lutea TaxID=572036 RepID=A0A1T5B3H9_9SPHI|nr:serine/threonine-protein kinase [Daejeonella lutea]SKB41520.1 Protein kinase domain-containing protein [Daejeonella lutea]